MLFFLAFHFSLSLTPNCRNWSPNYSVLVSFERIYCLLLFDSFLAPALLLGEQNKTFNFLGPRLICNNPVMLLSVSQLVSLRNRINKYILLCKRICNNLELSHY
jgi:hypothetical protein